MDEIELEGEIYISSKRASELTGYAKDYVGQLARSNKVKATRVGRAWYVGKNAIHEHAGIALADPHPSIEKNAETIEEVSESKEAIAPYEKLSLPLEQKESLRTLNELKNKGSAQSSLLKTWNEIQYLDDDQPLFPTKVLEVEEDTSSKISIRKLKTQNSDTRDKPKAIFNTISSNVDIKKSNSEKLIKTKPVRQPKLKQSNIKVPLLLEAVALSLFTVGIFSLSLLGGLYVPSEWSFNTHSFTANVVDVGLGFDLILEYFASIFASGIGLIGDFLDILFSTLEDFFAIGLNFILNLLNLG